MSLKPATSPENADTAGVEKAINDRLTGHLMEHAVKETVPVGAAPQNRSVARFVGQATALIGVGAMTLVLYLISVFDRKERLL